MDRDYMHGACLVCFAVEFHSVSFPSACSMPSARTQTDRRCELVCCLETTPDFHFSHSHFCFSNSLYCSSDTVYSLPSCPFHSPPPPCLAYASACAVDEVLVGAEVIILRRPLSLNLPRTFLRNPEAVEADLVALTPCLLLNLRCAPQKLPLPLTRILLLSSARLPNVPSLPSIAHSIVRFSRPLLRFRSAKNMLILCLLQLQLLGPPSPSRSPLVPASFLQTQPS